MTQNADTCKFVGEMYTLFHYMFYKYIYTYIIIWTERKEENIELVCSVL